MAPDAPVSRRAVLTGAAVLLGVGALGAAGVATGVVPGSAGIRRRLGLDGPDGVVPDVKAGTVTSRSVESAARGTQVSLATMTPAGVDAAGLPVLLALHGRGANAQTLVDLGLPQFLTAAVQAGAAPFAIAAVDGGDRYWHAVGSDDPQAMLRDEVPSWLADAGLGAVFGALGISMGAFGALLWARLAATPPAAVIAMSPALFRSWGDAKVADPADDLSWLLVAAPQESVDSIVEAYQLRRTELLDPHLTDRALLAGELALARWLLYGVRSGNDDVVDDAVQMLTELDEHTNDSDLPARSLS